MLTNNIVFAFKVNKQYLHAQPILVDKEKRGSVVLTVDETEAQNT